jgi:hypothetical protein
MTIGERSLDMTNVITLPKVHVNFFTNYSVQEMLKQGFSLPDIMDVHGAFFTAIAAGHSDDSIIGDAVSEGQAGSTLVRLIGQKIEKLTDAEWDQKQRRKAIFDRVPQNVLDSMSAAEWAEAANNISPLEARISDFKTVP